MKEAILVVKTLSVVCPCGTAVGPMVVGEAEWTPELARRQVNLQQKPEFSEGESAPICAWCGEFLLLPRIARENVRLVWPRNIPRPERE